MKHIIRLTLLTSLIFCSIGQAEEWDEGGTLTSSGILEWQQATAANKLASSADFLTTLYLQDMLNESIVTDIDSIDALKPYAIELVACIDAASGINPDEEKNKQIYATQSVAWFSSICVLSKGWGA